MCIQIDFNFKLSGVWNQTEIESSVLIRHFLRLFFKEIHKVLNLIINIIVLDVFLCTKFYLSALKYKLFHQVLSVISGCYDVMLLLDAMNYN